MTINLAIIIPALNEADSIAPVIASAKPFGTVVVVNDGSTDATAAIAAQAGADVVTLPVNRGYDAALNAGFAHANALGCTHAITIDADGQLPADRIPAFVAELNSGAELVIGRRDWVPRIAERLFRSYAQRRYGIQDPLCGMKAYDLRRYATIGAFDTYGSIGTELMLRMARAGVRIAQVDVPTKPRIGAARIGNALRANAIILRALLLAILRI